MLTFVVSCLAAVAVGKIADDAPLDMLPKAVASIPNTTPSVPQSDSAVPFAMTDGWLPVDFPKYPTEPCKYFSSLPNAPAGAVSRVGDAAAVCCRSPLDAFAVRNFLGLEYQSPPVSSNTHEFVCLPISGIQDLEGGVDVLNVASELCDSLCADDYPCGSSTDDREHLYSMYSCSTISWRSPRVPIPDEGWSHPDPTRLTVPLTGGATTAAALLAFAPALLFAIVI